MKSIPIIQYLLLILVAVACSKDDITPPPVETTIPPKETPPTETVENKAPAAFDLIDIVDGSDNIDLKPTFSWLSAVDPEGEMVTYDLYLDADQEPTTLIAENLFEPKFSITERLHLITEYKWRVVAKDAKGAQTSSETNSFATRNLKASDGPIAKQLNFSPRTGYGLITFKDKLWIIGGTDENEVKNDVWNSNDGILWTKVSPEFPVRHIQQFTPRENFTVSVFDNKIWIVGGYSTTTNNDEKGSFDASKPDRISIHNDVWSSTDGINWEEVTPNADFSPRFGHATIVYDNKLWVIGGNDGNRKNDIWNSSDGVTWTQVSTQTAFDPRNYHDAIVFQNKLWTLGGTGNNNVQKNDIWSSADGINWSQATTVTGFHKTTGRSSLVFDDKIMVIGGENDSNSSNEIWFSQDGSTWSINAVTNEFPLLQHTVSVVFKDKIFVVDSYSSEIWVLD